MSKHLWIYDFRTDIHFTLKTNPLKPGGLDDFVQCYRPGNRAARQESERFRGFPYGQLVARNKLDFDIFWLRDDSLEDIDSLPSPDLIAAEIVEILEAALEQFRSVAEELERI